MAESVKTRLRDESYWLRLPFMLVFFLAWQVTELLLMLVVLVQLVFRLFSGRPQERLLAWSSQLTRYAYQIFRYLTFNSQVKPFPFSDWPAVEPEDADPYQSEEQHQNKEQSGNQATPSGAPNADPGTEGAQDTDNRQNRDVE